MVLIFKCFVRIIRLLAAFAMAVLLFSILPLTRGLFHKDNVTGKGAANQPVLVMQQIKKEEKVPEPKMRALRTVNTNSSSVGSLRNMGFSMRFCAGSGCGVK
jgi:hypothetical protein